MIFTSKRSKREHRQLISVINDNKLTTGHAIPLFFELALIFSSLKYLVNVAEEVVFEPFLDNTLKVESAERNDQHCIDDWSKWIAF